METKTINSHVNFSLNYYLFLPNGYENLDIKWPLIMFLHGAGERGDSLAELDLVKVHGIPKYIKLNPDFPFIAICPQCPKNSYWPSQVEQLNVLLDEIISTYHVDESRVYLTGLSMGGYGTWYLANSYTEKFAAIAPICGSGIRSSGEKLSKLPIWVFHGDQDPVVPYADSEYLVNSIKKYGGDIKFTTYKNCGHNSWSETYANPELYEWFLSHKRFEVK
ncbi:MAG: phospholipase [Haloplasmataceae bacterium]|jgi:predicted peptidase|nr:phospholipase [Haloplasmataceae bacterium]